MTAAEALSRAAEILETEGWGQGRAHGPLGHCAVGAIALATGQDQRVAVAFGQDQHVDIIMSVGVGPPARMFREACNAVEDLLTLPGEPTQNIPMWNDDPLRTKEEVVKTLRVAADNLAAE